MRRLPILTNSAEKTFRLCQRLYYYQYEECYRPINTPEPLAVGTLQHAALEAWWNAAKADPNPPCPVCTGSDESGFQCQDCGGSGVYRGMWLHAAVAALASESDPFRRAQAEALAVGYHARWSKLVWEGPPYDGAPLEVLGVEVEFNGPLRNPRTGAPSKSWERGGKLDVLVRVRTSERAEECPVYVVEHKTKQGDFSAGSPYRAALRLDTQVSGYHVGGRFLAPRIDGVLYDVLGKPSFRPQTATPKDKQKWTKATGKEPSRLYSGQRLTDETPDEFQERVLDAIASSPDDYFARFEVVRLREEEEQAAQDTWQYGEMIRDARRLKRWPRNPSSCTAYGRACAFLPVCEGTATLQDGTRYRKAETPHEELGGAEEKQAA